MKSIALALSLVLTSGLATIVRSAEETAPTILDVWHGQAPGEKEKESVGEEKVERKAKNGGISSITNVSKPTLAVYRPDKAKDTGAAIVVCPGGGYNVLAWDHEGEQVARWLNSIGVTAAVLKYRVPRRPGSPKGEPPVQALMDAQRAVSLVRGKAEDWGIDPKRVGILGFSAGGHLGAWASTNADHRAYEPIDATDKVSCRPDFAVLVYPGGVLARGSEGGLSPEIHVTSDTPQMFLAHAGDDPVNAENSIALYLALKRAKVPAELHIYASGGHGFGMRPSDKPRGSWPTRCEEWMRDQGILKSSSGR